MERSKKMVDTGSTQRPLILYRIDLSPPCCAVMMLCDILGLEYESRILDLMKSEHKDPDYKMMNPMGTVPVLVDGDFIISESHAIMKYLLAEFGKEHEKGLYPSDPRTRALVDQCMYFDCGLLFINVKDITLSTLYHGLTGPTAKNIKNIEDGYSVLEAYLKNHKYIATDYLTLADLSLGATTASLQAVHPLEGNKYPRTVEWLERLNKEPYFSVSNRAAKVISNVYKSKWAENSA